jgi:hypothetical protein
LTTIMKKMHRFLLFVFLLTAIGACHEVIEPKPYEYSKLFTGKNNKTWAVTLLEETLNGKVVDRFTIDCANDDEFIFYASSDRLYEVKSGSQKCFTEEPTLTTDSWAFNNATATLTIILPFLSSNPLPFIVKEADDEEITLEIFFDEEGTASYKIYLESIDEE